MKVMQVDIGGHLQIPLGPPQLFLLVSLIVAQFTIFGCFSNPELLKPF